MRLRDVEDGDLDAFYTQQGDRQSYELAGLPPRDREAFDTHWARIRSDPAVTIRTIDVDGRVAGHVLSFARDGTRLAGYWLAREFWGHGLATDALASFLAIETHRPLVAEVSTSNVGSMRVLEKNGFRLLHELPDGYAFELR
jgi:RimJ/RimL family protein N-acetyltransferase